MISANIKMKNMKKFSIELHPLVIIIIVVEILQYFLRIISKSFSISIVLEIAIIFNI